MKTSRRKFICHSALTMAASVSSPFAGAGQSTANNQNTREMLQDGGMQLSEAYFWGMEKQKMDLARQMNILGAVGFIDPNMVGMKDKKPSDPAVLKATKESWQREGFTLHVIEGPAYLGNDTKLGLKGRDEEIENFILFMKNLKQYTGIDIICYNWMPVLDWYRTRKDKPGRGGALVTSFDIKEMKDEPLTPFGEVTKERLWANLEYFLKAVIPEAEKIGMKLAMHPDDPQIDSIRGISRIMTTVDNFDRMLKLVPSKYNGVTLCQGNFSLMGADIPALANRWGKLGLIHFVHFRNVRGGKFSFEETFHDEGQIDMYAAMKAYYDSGFRGPIRPDHVPTMAGDSNEKPGYSTLGIMYAHGYIRGLIEAVSKLRNA